MLQNRRVAIVLVGMGRMGRNHYRLLSESDLFDLVAVVDPQLDALPDKRQIPLVRSIEELDSLRIDYSAAVVASPTETHFDVAAKLAGRGKGILVEKPLAATSQEAQQLAEMAKARGAILAVGHVERYNPAVIKLKQVMDSGHVGDAIHLRVTRVGGYPSFVKPGNNVLVDLAIHDLDVLRTLVGPLRVHSSICHSTLRNGIFDTAEIMLVSESGVSASIHVNWITPGKIRTIRVTGTRGVCSVDYILQQCEMMGGDLLNRVPDLKADFNSLLSQYASTDKITFGVKRAEPLQLELEAFHRALGGDSSDICRPEDGIAALRLAEMALEYQWEDRGQPFT